MKLKYLHLILLISASMLVGCEPELVTTVDLPTEDPKLVVSAYLIPREQLHVIYISPSSPNNKPVQYGEGVDNAVVTVSDGDKKVTLTKMYNGFYFFEDIDLHVLPGKQYHLGTYAPGFPHDISATCTIPEDFNPQMEVLSVDSRITGSNLVLYTVNVRFRDVPGKGDFYRISCHALVTSDPDPIDTIYQTMYTPGSEPCLFTDEGKDGQWFQFSFTYEHYPYSGESVEGFALTILRTDEPYYKFHYPFVVLDYYDDENPFGEPAIIYTNIQNGYGIFAGAVEKRYRINL